MAIKSVFRLFTSLSFVYTPVVSIMIFKVNKIIIKLMINKIKQLINNYLKKQSNPYD